MNRLFFLSALGLLALSCSNPQNTYSLIILSPLGATTTFDTNAATVNLYLLQPDVPATLETTAAVSAGSLNIPIVSGTGAWEVQVTDNSSPPITVDFGRMPLFNLQDIQNGSSYGIFVSAPKSLTGITTMSSPFVGTPLCSPFNADYLVFADTGALVPSGTSADAALIGGVGVFNLLTFTTDIEDGIFTGIPQFLLAGGSNMLAATSDTSGTVFASGGSSTTTIATPTKHTFSEFHFQTVLDDSNQSIALGLTGVLMFTTSGTLQYIQYVTPRTTAVTGVWIPNYGLVIVGDGADSELLATGTTTFTTLGWSSSAVAIGANYVTGSDAATTYSYTEVLSDGTMTTIASPYTNHNPVTLDNPLPNFGTALSFMHSYSFPFGDFAIVTGDSSGNVNLYWVNPAESKSQSFALPVNSADCATTVGTVAFATKGDTTIRWFNGEH